MAPRLSTGLCTFVTATTLEAPALKIGLETPPSFSRIVLSRADSLLNPNPGHRAPLPSAQRIVPSAASCSGVVQSSKSLTNVLQSVIGSRLVSARIALAAFVGSASSNMSMSPRELKVRLPMTVILTSRSSTPGSVDVSNIISAFGRNSVWREPVRRCWNALSRLEKALEAYQPWQSAIRLELVSSDQVPSVCATFHASLSHLLRAWTPG